MRYDPIAIEEHFKKFIRDMPIFLPEGAIEVDIDFLERFNLLKLDKTHDTALTRYFNVAESQEKITLVNDEFVIWIIPDSTKSVPHTLVLIALNHEGNPHLELAFRASDIYNSSKLVLRILEKLLFDIQENEDSLKPYLKP
jgi:hypothetical protein